EGLPTVLLEAACLNVPIVATDCPSGPREILESIGEGHLVPLGDDAALEAALRSALRGDRGPTGFWPDAEAADRFRADALFGDYLELLGLI
ncbi:MAG: hypothetical protein QOI80_786, partial [Solirubrobacteraceae bacterium]|nr:hypothetical protein [Solirubrobacteraceae bacterium]